MLRQAVEVWSNRFNKWAVLDPHFGCYFEKRSRSGIPLSALEIHNLLVREKRTEIVKKEVNGDKEIHPVPDADPVDYFHHLAMEMRNNHLSVPLHAWNRRDTYLAWIDEFTHGKPEIYTRFSRIESDFEFPMNQIQVSLQPTRLNDTLACLFRTNMPHAESFRIKCNDAPPRFIPIEEHNRKKETPMMTIPLKEGGLILMWRIKLKPGKNRVSFQAVNGSGVEGPPAVFELVFNRSDQD